jgi:hypothetical protein
MFKVKALFYMFIYVFFVGLIFIRVRGNIRLVKQIRFYVITLELNLQFNNVITYAPKQ